MKNQRGFGVIAVVIGIVTIATIGIAAVLVASRSDSNDSASTVTTSVESLSDRSITNDCFTLSLPSDVPSSVQLIDKSTADSCRFTIQFEEVADAPIAVGEVFTGSYSLQEKLDFIPDGLSQGYELDLLDLGALGSFSSGQYSSFDIFYEQDGNLNGQQAVFYTHTSNRSISGQANSAVIVAPSGSTVGGREASTLFVWGVSNNRNADTMERILETVVWK